MTFLGEDDEGGSNSRDVGFRMRSFGSKCFETLCVMLGAILVVLNAQDPCNFGRAVSWNQQFSERKKITFLSRWKSSF